MPFRPALIAACIAMATAVPSQSINVNFTGVSGRPVEGAAGVAPAANWNNFGGSSGSSMDLEDATGASTSADLTWEAQAEWQTNTPATSEDANILDGYLAVGDTEYNYDITVTGIPYASYDVIVYFGNNAMGADGNIRLNGGGTQFFYETSGILPDFAGFQLVEARLPSAPAPGNYVRYDGVVGSTLTIQQANLGGGQDSGVMGFQIVDRGAVSPYAFVDASLFRTDEDITVTFSGGPGAADNNFVLTSRGGDPGTEVLARRYVGGGDSPTTGETSGTILFENGGDAGFGWIDLYWLEDDAGGAVLQGPITFQVVPPDPQVVPVGAGSYASAPPAHEGEVALFEAYQRTFFIDESAASRPAPTNDWWTDLIVSRYAGVMWAYPLTLSMDEQGTNVTNPVAWNPGGTEMEVDSPIQVRGEVVPVIDPDVLIVADFESETYPPGWTTTGTAFGSGPAAGALPTQSPVSGFLGERLVNSFNGGDSPTGTLTSPPFTIERDYMHLLVGGGNHPGSAAVNLLVGGSPVLSATGVDSEMLTWRTWDVSAFIGQSAQIEIVDFETGGWGHVLCDQIFQSSDPDPASGAVGTQFRPLSAKALDWSDWTVTARQENAAGQRIDVTFGHGLPFAWFEASDVTMYLQLQGVASFFDAAGSPVDLSGETAVSNLGIEQGGRSWGLFLPAGTTAVREQDRLNLVLPPSAQWLVLGALPSSAELTLFANHARAIPRDSRFDWEHLPSEGIVRTTWNLTMEQLGPGSGETIQGWIAHHWRGTENSFDFSSGVEFTSPRGRLRCTTGTEWTIDFPFAGLAPNIPPPAQTGLADDFNPATLASELARAATITEYGGDTYFGGKDLGRFAHYMAAAVDGGDPSADQMISRLRAAMADWYTYTPGETEHYFARFDRSGGMIGFNESFFSIQYTDHHFHYGYHTTAMGLLSLYDPSFSADYGAMARLVAKDYANWERGDTDYPFLRTFDIWKGHSLAGGFSSGAGNNQESTSEATQSWAGLFFLGRALGDDAMAAAGAMGYAIESAAVMEYWFDINGDILEPSYDKGVVGILFDRGPAYATFFSGDPAWIYGIQWVPLHPTIFQYFTDDRPFAETTWNNMVSERMAEGLGATDIADFGSSLGNILLDFVALFDVDEAAAEWNRLASINSNVVTDNFTGGLSYYFIHAMRSHGYVDSSYHMSEPLGNVFRNPRDGSLIYVAFNPEASPKKITVFQGDAEVGCFTAEAHVLTTVTELEPCETTVGSAWRNIEY